MTGLIRRAWYVLRQRRLEADLAEELKFHQAMKAGELTRVMSSLLFGVTATDPATYAAARLILIALGLFAASLPARRAMRLDPVVALRWE